MRVGIVSTSYPRATGDGAGAFVAGLAGWLAGRGAHVEVVAAGPGGALVDGIPVWRVDGRGLFYQGGAPEALEREGASPWGRAVAFAARLASRVAERRRGWDAVVSHWVLPCGLAVAAVAPCLPHVAVAHSADVALLRRSRVGRGVLGLLARRADLVYAARHLIVAGAPGRVVPMGIDVASLVGGDREGTRRRLGLAGVTALFLGRLVPVKGLDRLLEALPPGIELLVAGDGPMFGTWRAQAARQGRSVRFLGEVRAGEKADLLAAADFLVVPSRVLPGGRTEGTPTVVFEAMAAGLPIVATRVGGVAEAFRDEEEGLLVAPESRAELGHALARMAESEELRKRLGRCARRAASLHDWSRVGPLLVGSGIKV